MKIVLLFGPPGAGKSTVGRRLRVMFHLPYIIMSDVMRNLPKDSPDYQVFQAASSNGNLVPNEVVGRILKSYVEQNMASCEHVMIDGFPRTTSQANMLYDIGDVIAIYHLRVPEETIIERLKRRAIQENRDDDDEQIVRHRYAVYAQHTCQVLDVYRKANDVALHDIDATQPLDDVVNNITTTLSQILKSVPHKVL